MARDTHSGPCSGKTIAILRAISDPRRYDILMQLAAADRAVPCCTLIQAGQVSASTMSHHLQQLEQAGLIEVSRDGKFAILQFARACFEDFLRQLAADSAPASPPQAGTPAI